MDTLTKYENNDYNVIIRVSKSYTTGEFIALV